MFAIGHFALGYLTGKGSSRLLKTQINLPLLLVASILPDIDLVLERVNYSIFMHRGPLHSIITFTVFMIPFFVLYRKKSLPYYVALLSHSLLGDFLTGGIEKLWPISNEWFGGGVAVYSITNITAELVLFAVVLVIMLRTKDLQSLWKPQLSNLFLIVPFGAIMGPVLQLGTRSGISAPALLVIPSIFWAVVFAYSIFAVLIRQIQRPLPTNPKADNSNSLVEVGGTIGKVWIPNFPRRVARSCSCLQQTD
jgi:membrane-bound metal-dependent hydrolase YbcI (DUF457 family)